ncbi:MAG: energy transducer TonB [Candidatus Binatia bacterium]
MKLALFFFLSFAVHAAAILVPISLNGPGTARAIQVTILPMESATEPSGGPGGHAAADRVTAKNFAKTPTERTGDIAPASPPAALERLPTESPPVGADTSVTSISGVSMVGTAHRTGDSYGSDNGADGNNLAGGRSGTGSGNGAGNGEGSGTGQAGTPLIQARYRETPQPHYPDSARREGKEGRVLLRVLVDEEGRTKAIEVNTSSGHDMLDQAATEALKKWRFVPARVSGIPIETWVKVPIEFQLSNAKR